MLFLGEATETIIHSKTLNSETFLVLPPLDGGVAIRNVLGDPHVEWTDVTSSFCCGRLTGKQRCERLILLLLF